MQYKVKLGKRVSLPRQIEDWGKFVEFLYWKIFSWINDRFIFFLVHWHNFSFHLKDNLSQSIPNSFPPWKIWRYWNFAIAASFWLLWFSYLIFWMQHHQILEYYLIEKSSYIFRIIRLWTRICDFSYFSQIIGKGGSNLPTRKHRPYRSKN